MYIKIDKDHIFFKVTPIIIGAISLFVAHKSLENSSTSIRIACEQHSELESCRSQFTFVEVKPQKLIFKRPRGETPEQTETALVNPIFLVPEKHSMDF
ncbi:MAG: hypothetical protein KA717_33835 [Woronichinia naegeliana WA131]|jgi:hypothetical protein|uniref:Uncharacterized protein n=1 Tax=Woronichinia naegeliana WA131 TaxID=2824559 RepID=A0A977PWD8_9CYAN|nr:MAG: hypothetical protein KA717_33835 [Woronichinia naegeliana WA131]